MEINILHDLLGTVEINKNQFANEFITNVSWSRLHDSILDLREKVGSVVDVEKQAAGTYKVSTETHMIDINIVLTDDARIAGLRFRSRRSTVANFEDTTNALVSLEGQVAVYVTCEENTLFEHNADVDLAVGSAFKISVLAELEKLIRYGSHTWSDVVALREYHLSLPSGILQDMPTGSPLTLHSLAALMISISDNTATDALIDIVGRDALINSLGPANLLSTREFFILKTNDKLRRRYLALPNSEKAVLLDELRSMAIPNSGTIPPYQPGVEWYLSARKLATLMQAVKHLDVMSISPGPARKDDWQHIAYKGGSEIGVRNRSIAVTDRNNKQYIAVVTINADESSKQSFQPDRFDSLCEDLVSSLSGTQ